MWFYIAVMVIAALIYTPVIVAAVRTRRPT